jgi:hypothetical protein
MKGLNKKRVEDMIDLLLDYKKISDRNAEDESLTAPARKVAQKASSDCEKMLQDLSQIEDDRMEKFMPLFKMALKSLLSTFTGNDD